MKRVMIDMSATILHHGHIRLIEKAKKYGQVIIGLTTDDEILEKKGYSPEIKFEERKEILEAIEGINEVVETPWLITEKVLDDYSIDLLIHGQDNSNKISKDRLLVFPRTKGISSSQIRYDSLQSITQINNRKLMLTPGPAVVLHENLKDIKPVFGRGDEDYDVMSAKVLEWVRHLSGQDEVIMSQGSSTFSLELALHSFVSGKVLLISTGYYSDRLKVLSPSGCQVKVCSYEEIDNIKDDYNWVLCAYTETSKAFKIDLEKVKNLCEKVNAKLYVDATGSIGLEDKHHLADVMAFSSCKGLFGLTGASFVAHKNNLKYIKTPNFYFNLETHMNKMVTGPYHAVASLHGVMVNHDKLVDRVKKSKEWVMANWSNYILSKNNQPLLCTYLNGKIKAKDSKVVLYNPRSELKGSVICHFGEIHSDRIDLKNRIEIAEL
tara:strand:+ start:19975 stop:21282 length:1308 start_codon:yes stop_codon:yes gene_type:complete